MERVVIIFSFVLFLSGCQSNSFKIGYYEPKAMLMDESIQLQFHSDDFSLLKDGFSAKQTEALNSILTNKDLHKESELGTCEISGLIVLSDKTVYLTCGTAQLVISHNNSIQKILLNEKGYSKLSKLIKGFRN